jgi:hypothetical protein
VAGPIPRRCWSRTWTPTAAPTGHTGLDFIDPAEAPRFVALDREGFQVHFHALATARSATLDAIEAARAAGRRQRPTASPGSPAGGASHDAIPPEFAALSATAHPGAVGAHEPQMDVLTIPFWGGERAGSIRSGRCTPPGRRWQ